MVVVMMDAHVRRRGFRAVRSKGLVLLGALSLLSAATLSLLPSVASASSTTTTTTGTTLYVTPGGSETTCSAIAPCSLTHAITLANGTTGDTIMVGAGTYDTGAHSTNTNLKTGTIKITASMTIMGAGADQTFIGGTSTSDQVAGSVFEITTSTTTTPVVTISGVTIQYGNSTSTINGGGILNFGTLTATNDTISENSASRVGLNGGGIFNGGTLTATNDTISGNSAPGGTESFNAGGIYNNGSVTATNDTISGNSAFGGFDNGGGIFNYNGTLTATNDTISGNSASGGTDNVGGILSADSFTIAASIVADQVSGGDCGGSITDAGYNLESGTSCGFSAINHSLQSTNPLLGSLANNGGPTQTMAITSSSPAYDVIPSSSTLCSGGSITLNSSSVTIPLTDQRGVLRLLPGAGCDIGAYQVGSISLTPQTLAPAHLNQSYSVTFTTTNTYQPAYSISSGALPDGLALDTTTGTISGTPKQVGNFSFTLSIQSGSVLGALTQPYTINVTNAPPPPHITFINPTQVPQYTASFITISGRDLTTAGTTCYGAAEMTRCGVSVTIGGLPATVAYASPTTLDVITPKVGVSTLWVVVHVGAESSNAVLLRITSRY